MKLSKYIKVLIFGIGIFVLEISVLFFVIEYSGIFNVGKSIYRYSIGYEEAQFEKSDQYLDKYGERFIDKKNRSAEDPYEPFNIKYLHPFYLFSSAWRKNQIEFSNNNIVSSDSDGFRLSYNNSSPFTGMILGGSTAYGIGSTTNLNTISSVLNYNQTKINFRNRAVPSWNSNQELISFVKNINQNDEMVISITGINDLVNGWNNICVDEEIPLDAQQHFFNLEKALGDSRTNFSEIIRTYLPNTHRLSVKFKEHFITDKDIEVRNYCELDEDDLVAIANTFLENQKKMANFSKSYDVDFYTVLQPFTHLHHIPSDLVDYSDPNKEIKYKNDKGDYYSLFAVTYNPQDDIEYEPLLLDYVQKYYKYIIGTDFCENYCIDATNIFEGEGDNLSDFMDDSIHLTDLGVNVMVENLLQDVNFQK